MSRCFFEAEPTHSQLRQAKVPWETDVHFGLQTPLRHAFVGGEQEAHGERLLPVAWVMLSRWDHDSGEVEF
jgi:hypothetical protein